MRDRFDSFTYLILKLSKIIQKIKNVEVEEFGLKAIHVMCIYHLNQNPRGLTASEIVALTLEDKAAISRALNLLKEMDIVNYEPKKYNGIVSLTIHGIEIAEKIDEKAKTAVDAGSYNLNMAEREVLYRSLSKIEDNLDNYYKELVGNEE